MKKLIINADDFGMSREVNEGTKRAIRSGIISSVSLMTNMPYYADAVKFLEKYPNVSVGLHFNITEGTSILPPSRVSHLLREDNSFYHWRGLVWNLVGKEILESEILDELRAQYRRLKSSKLKITHIDSHHHIHLHPKVFKVVSRFASENHVDSLRCHEFNLWNLSLGIMKKPVSRQCIVNMMILYNNYYNKKTKYPHQINRFYDLNWAKALTTKDLTRILEGLPNETTEFICHVAVNSVYGNQNFLQPREDILNLLINNSVKKRILKNGITLINRTGEPVHSLHA